MWAKAVKLRDSYMCRECGNTGKKRYMHAHHIKSYKEYPKLRYTIENGITLCLKCHVEKHPELKDLMVGRAKWQRRSKTKSA
jgi:5-methylcytosine-specific restriction endonuclease McrA